jgi:hypothetical protein
VNGVGNPRSSLESEVVQIHLGFGSSFLLVRCEKGYAAASRKNMTDLSSDSQDCFFSLLSTLKMAKGNPLD